MKNQLLLVLISVLFLAGCGEPKVKGKVTFPDGTPLKRGMVMFQNDQIMASGNISANGTYSVGRLKDGDGVPPGKYQVYLSGTQVFDADDTAPEVEIGASGLPTSPGHIAATVDLVDRKFTSPNSSGLNCDVSGNMTFDIKVEAPK